MLSLFSSDLAIELGTAKRAYYAAAGHRLTTSIVAINKVNGGVEAVGQRTRRTCSGRTPGNIVAIKAE